VKRISAVVLVAALVVVGGALYLLSLSTGHSAAFGQWHLWLIVANVVVGLFLLAVIALNLWRLGRSLRRSRTGARLTRRLVVLFTALSVLPVGAVFYFSVQFINRSIDSWFDVNVAHALQDSLTLSRKALASETGPYAGATAQAARMLSDRGPEALGPALDRLRGELGADSAIVFDNRGEPRARSLSGNKVPAPPPPTSAVIAGLAAKGPKVTLFAPGSGGLYVKVLAPLPAHDGTYQVLQTVYPVNGQASGLARRVEAAYSKYRELNYMRQPLKLSFTLTLSLVLLLSLLAAVWAAFFAADRVAAPVRELVRATRAVARGDFDVRVAEKSRDEIGFLARSFNDMTRRLAAARIQTRRGQAALERERTWLATVLGALSAGVVTLDAGGHVRSVNAAAASMLGIDAAQWVGRPMEGLLIEYDNLRPLFDSARPPDGSAYDVDIRLPAGERTLRAALTRLPGGDGAPPPGRVWVFEDVSRFIQAQRQAAWGEVARRLAHEIKNPLTPIQLAAERLRMKCLPALAGREAEVLDRATSTVIAQVHAMQGMVDAFSEYAKNPPLRLAAVDVGALAREVVELYRGRHGLAIELDVSADLPEVTADAARLRQVLHNLIKNAIEAQETRLQDSSARVWVSVAPSTRPEGVALTVRDAGAGFDESLLANAFEPYVTTKHKGTGLGLSLVRKLAEEQGGRVTLGNAEGGGAEVVVLLARRHPAPRALEGGVS